MEIDYNEKPPINPAGKQVGLTTYQTKCRITFYALVKIAAAYHREFYEKEVEMFENNPELLGITKKHNSAHINQTIRQLKTDHQKVQKKLLSIHNGFEYSLKNIEGAEERFKHYFEFLHESMMRLFVIDDALGCIQLLDMFRSGDFNEAFDKMREAASEAAADALAEQEEEKPEGDADNPEEEGAEDAPGDTEMKVEK